MFPIVRFWLKPIISKTRRASTSGSFPSQSSKRKRSATTHAASASARKTLFDESYDDEAGDDESGDAVEEDDEYCVGIPLTTPIRYVTKLTFEGNQDEKDVAPSTAEDARVKAVVDDCVDTPLRNVGHFQGSAGIDPSPAGPFFAAPGTTDDDIERDFFLPCMVLIMLIIRRMKEVGTLQEKVEAFEDALVRVKEKSKGHKKKVRSLTKALDQFTSEAARVASDLNDAYKAEAYYEIICLKGNNEALNPHFVSFFWGSFQGMVKRLEPYRLARPTPTPTPRAVVVSPPSSKESTVTHASPPKELAYKDARGRDGADAALVPKTKPVPCVALHDVVVGLTAEKENEDVPSASQDVPAASEDGSALSEA
nr:hypothetical protein [Tanacetum cinerariifolium]